MKANPLILVASAALLSACASTQAPQDTTAAQPSVEACGPQAPRDISQAGGTNSTAVREGATPNLCNVHFHSPFEHAGFDPFETPAGTGDAVACGTVKVGDRVEFHWVHTNCELPATPKPGLDNCVCDRPDLTLRVVTQAYVVGSEGLGLQMPEGDLVEYAGSTTGPSYSDEVCSPPGVNWRVNRSVETLAHSALTGFCADNPWNEDHAHGIRALVQREDWLSPFQP